MKIPGKALLASLVLGLTGACAATSARADGPAPPLPYSAAELRDAIPAGTKIVFRIEAGEQVSTLTMSFSAVDENGTTFTTSAAAADGSPIDEPSTSTASWDELRDHALFPPGTTRQRTTVTVPAGTYDVWRYTVHDRGGVVEEFDFAPDLPGPPVRKITRQGEQLIFSMALVARS